MNERDCRLEWVSAFHRQGSLVPGTRQLQLLGVDINVVVAVEGFSPLPSFVKGTDRVALIQEGLAQQIAPPRPVPPPRLPLRRRASRRELLVAPVAGPRPGEASRGPGARPGREHRRLRGQCSAPAAHQGTGWGELDPTATKHRLHRFLTRLSYGPNGRARRLGPVARWIETRCDKADPIEEQALRWQTP